MGLLTNLIMSVVHILLVGIDILFVLLLVRIASCKWQPKWLVTLDNKVKPIVKCFTGHVEKGLMHISKRTPSERVLLLSGMLTLSILRLLITTLVRCWI